MIGNCKNNDKNNRKNNRFFFSLETNTISDVADRLNNIIVQNDKMLINLTEPNQNAHDHAAYLYNRSLELDSLLTDTRNTNAVRAVSAYRNIETAIQAAKNATDHAIIAAENATSLVKKWIYKEWITI